MSKRLTNKQLISNIKKIYDETERCVIYPSKEEFKRREIENDRINNLGFWGKLWYIITYTRIPPGPPVMISSKEEQLKNNQEYQYYISMAKLRGLKLDFLI